MLEQIKNRLKSPWVWVGITGLAYNIISQHVQISSATYQSIVDILSYILVGVGIYSNHTESSPQNNGNQDSPNTNSNNSTPSNFV